MRLKFYYGIVILAISLFFSLTGVAQEYRGKQMRGEVIYGADKAIYGMALPGVNQKILDARNEADITKLYEREAEFSHLSKFNDDKFLFEQWDDSGRFIKEFNRKTNRVRTLHAGEFPVCMPKHHKFLFWGDGLEIASIDSPIKTTKKIANGGTINREIVPVSDDEVVFMRENVVGPGGYSMGVWIYNLSTNSLKQLPLNGCAYPQVWVGSLKELFCGGDKKKGAPAQSFLTNLQGHIDHRLSFGDWEYPVLYIPETNQLLVSKTVSEHFGEVSHLWAYDLDTGKKQMISKHNGFSLGDGIYYTNSLDGQK